MKKLLALILCVMMFVAVIPTAAFAGNGVAYHAPLDPAVTTDHWAGKYAATKAVEDMSNAVKAMYGAIAADQGVFNTVVAIDDTIKSMADGMFDGIDKLTIMGHTFDSNKKLTDATKSFLRSHIGDEISKYMNEHSASFTETKKTANGIEVDIVDPIKYMNTFATAASKAMSSDKAVKNIEALYYTAAFAKAQKEAKDKMSDIYDDYRAWGGDFADYGWASIVGSTGWEPYVFINAQNPYYDDTPGSNIQDVLGDLVP